MRIYLAGKVSKNGWRTQLVPGAELDGFDDPWPVLEGVIFGEHDYIGPFLYGCNHGCFHGRHGMAAGGADQPGCTGEYGLDPAEIVRRCLNAVRQADLVFCWLEAPGDYGSMFEAGYALALGKQVVIAGNEEDLINSHWFAWFASVIVEAETPLEALRRAVQKAVKLQHDEKKDQSSLPHGTVLYNLPVKVWNRCGSPIERVLLSAMATAAVKRNVRVVLKVDGEDIRLTDGKGEGLVIYLQHKVCGHRADFMIEHGESKAVIECDGHNYHERTREQAKHDRSLDRELQRSGYRVLRFTGKEIHGDPENCAMEVINDLLSQESRP